MPRKELSDVGASDNFADRVYLLKREQELALLDPDAFIRTMADKHLPMPPKKDSHILKIRLLGPIREVVREINAIRVKFNCRVRIMKLARDKTKRDSDFACDVIRAYINVK
jgi:hypothetical protein